MAGGYAIGKKSIVDRGVLQRVCWSKMRLSVLGVEMSAPKLVKDVRLDNSASLKTAGDARRSETATVICSLPYAF